MNAFSKYLLIILGVALAGFLLWYFLSIVAYILVAAVLSLIGRPLVGFLGRIHWRKFRIPNGISALITLALIWLVIFGFLRLFVPLIATEANELSQMDTEILLERLDKPVQIIEKIYYDFNTGEAGPETFEDFIAEKIANVLDISLITNFFGSVVGLLGNMFIAVFSISFITFFLLKDRSVITDFVVLLIPQKHEEAIRSVISSVRHLLIRYFIGIMGQITAIMIMITVGMVIVGIDLRLALIIALIVGLLNVIPYLGPLLGGSIGILLGIANNLQMDLSVELLPLVGSMLLVVLIVQATDNVLFQPLIFSSSVKAHPLEIFLVILIAGTLAGIPGMILGIPTYTVIRVFSKEFLSQVRVVKKLTRNM